jgi:hypothetical protein
MAGLRSGFYCVQGASGESGVNGSLVDRTSLGLPVMDGTSA